VNVGYLALTSVVATTALDRKQQVTIFSNAAAQPAKLVLKGQ